MGEPDPAESKTKVFERHDVPFLPDRARKGTVRKTWRQEPIKADLFTSLAPTVNNCNKSDGMDPIDVLRKMRKKIETIGSIFGLTVYMGLLGYLLFFTFMPPGLAGVAFTSIAIWIFFLLSAASSFVVKSWTNHAIAILLLWITILGASLAEGGIGSDWFVFLILFLVHSVVQGLAAFVAERIRTEAEPGDAENGGKPLGDERTP